MERPLKRMSMSWQNVDTSDSKMQHAKNASKGQRIAMPLAQGRAGKKKGRDSWMGGGGLCLSLTPTAANPQAKEGAERLAPPASPVQSSTENGASGHDSDLTMYFCPAKQQTQLCTHRPKRIMRLSRPAALTRHG